jgi:putative phosphoribosyl transferase
VIVDDGLATGSTARAAIQIARARGARRVVLAAPVAPPETVAALEADADEVVVLLVATDFRGVGQFYEDFSQTPAAEVVELLERSQEWLPEPAPDHATTPAATFDAEVAVSAGQRALPGHLTVPPDALGVVLFAHGSGSSRSSPRNRAVATHLNRAGLATLLFDLLDPQEAEDRSKAFDIPLLGSRLALATQWVTQQPATEQLPVGYFGASTGAGAALWAAAIDGNPVRAIVSRGGRPDLAFDRLSWVQAPTLLIVGGNDDVVLELNRDASRRLTCERQLVVVPGAGHLFEEPGALETVADLAAVWFVEHLGASLPANRRT